MKLLFKLFWFTHISKDMKIIKVKSWDTALFEFESTGRRETIKFKRWEFQL